MYKSNLVRNLVVVITTLSLLGSFAIPTAASAADIGSILASIGIGNGSVYGSATYNNYYSSNNSYNDLSSHSQGDIRLSKQVRDTSKGSGFHESITVRSGALVQVWIQVKNQSKYNADTYVSDQITGSSVYVPNSLAVNGTATAGSLTSGGLHILLGPKSNIIITYSIRVCSDYGYAARATAYSAAIGSATDATAIKTEQFQTYGSNIDFTSTCLNSFQQTSSSSGSTTNASSSNPFGNWTGVNSNTTTATNNPFGNWTGVNSNTSSSTQSNPFGGWTGVNSNSSSSTSSNPFGDWNGVNSNSSSNSSNPFGNWTGVNSNTTNNYSSNPFGDWSGVNSNSTSNSSLNPFGDWSGVNSNSNSNTNSFGDWNGVNSYTASGYTANNNMVASADSSNFAAQSYSAPSETYYVAPTTGVDKFAPIWFASLLTLTFLAYRKRKLIFG